MKKRLIEFMVILIIFILTIGITYARFQLTDNVTGSINVYSYDYCQENGFTKLSECMLVMENYSRDVESAKAYIESKAAADPSAIAPTITYIEETKEVSNSNYYSTAHFTIGKSYTFDETSGMYTLIDHTNDVLKDEYIGYYTCGATTGTYPKCSKIYQILEYNISSNSTSVIYKITKAIVHDIKMVDSFDSQIGLYAQEDNDGTSYFYRGDVKNNYVSFAGYTWRIVRLNGDNSVRMVYSGTSTSSTGSQTSIAKSVYNSKVNDATYLGYKYNEDFELKVNTTNNNYSNISDNLNYYYGTGYEFDEETKLFHLTGNKISGMWKEVYENAISNYPYTCLSTNENGTCSFVLKLKAYRNDFTATVNYISYSSKNYESTLLNTTDSTMKSVVDKWYEDNLLNNTDANGVTFHSYLADSAFCNDRSLYGGNGYSFEVINTYGAYRRVFKNKLPILTCNQSSDIFKVSNGNLKYPIALLSIDEVSLAGGLYLSTNYKYYLYTGQAYWTMSPSIFSNTDVLARLWYVTTSGSTSAGGGNITAGVRPVINLKSDVEIIRGTGTADDPYIITE